MSGKRECLPLTSLSQVLEWLPQTSNRQTNEKLQSKSPSRKLDTDSQKQLKDIQPGSGEKLKGTQPGSGEKLKGTRLGSGEQLKDTQPGSGEQLKEIQPGSGEQLKDIQPESGEQLKDIQPESGEQLKDTQPGSGEQLKDIQPGSGEQLKDIQPESGEQLKEIQPGSGEQLKDIQPGSGEQLKDIQPGSGEQLKDIQPGSGEQLKDIQTGSDEQLKDIQPGNREQCNDFQSESDSHRSVKRSSFCLPGSCWTSCGTWEDLVSTALQDTRESPKTLVCHDMQGGYLQDRWSDGCDEDGYYFTHWTHIDIFVYFSHHLVTIPPEGWISAARRHGTTILGTIITEWDEGKVIMEELLENEDKRNKFVSVCAEIAKTKGFHGWLINIENPISERLVPSLLMFVSSLTLAVKAAVPGGMVIWYDSVTIDGQLKWQNELNENNKPFFDLCDGIFLNYTWKVGSDDTLKDSDNPASENAAAKCDEADNINNLSRSIDCLADSGRRGDIFVGVDVFGRGCLGGGGFNCRQPLEVIRQYGLSTAIFAPGWTYEGRQPAEDFASREITFWRLLQPYLSFRGAHLKSPRVRVGRRQPHTVFQTCFSSGRGAGSTAGGSTHPAPPRAWFNLKKMEFQPSFPAVNDGENKTACYVSGQHWYRPSQSLLVAGPPHSTVPVLLCRLEVEPATPTLFLLVLKGMRVPDVEVRLGIVGGIQIVPERMASHDMDAVEGNIDMPEEKEGWEKLAFLLDKGLVVDKIGLYLGSNEELYLGHFSIHCLGTLEF